MKERFEVRRHSFSKKLTFALTLSLTVAIGLLSRKAFAQIPSAEQTYAPVWGNPQDVANQRARCKTLFKEINATRAMTPAQQAKLPQMNEEQGGEWLQQMKDCMRLFPPAGPKPSAAKLLGAAYATFSSDEESIANLCVANY